MNIQPIINIQNQKQNLRNKKHELIFRFDKKIIIVIKNTKILILILVSNICDFDKLYFCRIEMSIHVNVLAEFIPYFKYLLLIEYSFHNYCI